MQHPEPAEFMCDDGVTLRAHLWNRGQDVALLVHQPGGDLDRWIQLALALDEIGVSVLAFDLRGHGLSDGTWNPDRLGQDIGGALSWLRERYGGISILIAEGLGADESVKVADDGTIAALVLLSPIQPPGQGGRDSACPKLIVVGGQDPDRLAVARDFCDHIVGPHLLLDLPTKAQGADLLRGPFSMKVIESINAFLAVDLGLKRKSEVGS
ncbi:MAG: alpha/beta hydrolase [Candidatus Dormibacteraceae bacterium]